MFETRMQLGLVKGDSTSYRVEIEPALWGLVPRSVSGDMKEAILKISVPREMVAGDLGHFRLWLVRGEGAGIERTLVSTRAVIRKEVPGWIYVPWEWEGWIAVGIRGEIVR